jgi:hypothetical protein
VWFSGLIQATFSTAIAKHSNVCLQTLRMFVYRLISASSRISKGQRYQGFLKGKGQGAVLAKKGQFASYKEKLEKWTEFHYWKPS